MVLILSFKTTWDRRRRDGVGDDSSIRFMVAQCYSRTRARASLFLQRGLWSLSFLMRTASRWALGGEMGCIYPDSDNIGLELSDDGTDGTDEALPGTVVGVALPRRIFQLASLREKEGIQSRIEEGG